MTQGTPISKDPALPWGSTYRLSRPAYPRSLFEFLALAAPSRRYAWDSATGNGQAAVGLAQFFDQVEATDVSADQIANAIVHDRITYRVESAETPSVAPDSLDLIVVGQALHWLDRDTFFRVARLSLKPEGVLAAFSYLFFEVSGLPRSLIEKFDDEFVRPNVHPQWEAAYSAGWPIDEVETPQIAMSANWNFASFSSFLTNKVSVQQHISTHGRGELQATLEDLALAWGEPRRRRLIRWPLRFRAGRCSRH